MEQTVPGRRVRPTIEEVNAAVYSPSSQCKRYLVFVEAVVIEHGKDMSILDLEETIRLTGRVASRALEKIQEKGTT